MIKSWQNNHYITTAENAGKQSLPRGTYDSYELATLWPATNPHNFVDFKVKCKWKQSDTQIL
jgi:hypothetical protein